MERLINTLASTLHCLISMPTLCHYKHLKGFLQSIQITFILSGSWTWLRTPGLELQSLACSYTVLIVALTFYNLCHSDLFRMEHSGITKSHPAITWSRHATHSWFQYRCQQRKKQMGGRGQTSSRCAIPPSVFKKLKLALLWDCDKQPYLKWSETLTVRLYEDWDSTAA